MLDEAIAKYRTARATFGLASSGGNERAMCKARDALDAAVREVALAAVAAAFPHGCESSACSTYVYGSKDWMCRPCTLRAEVHRLLPDTSQETADAEDKEGEGWVHIPIPGIWRNNGRH